MQNTPNALRQQIAIFGQTNVGKSTLFNLLNEHEISIVSNVAGTTANSVKASMEFKNLGPTTVIDTAGFNDTGELGEKRVKKALEEINKTNFAILVVKNPNLNEIEKELINKFNTFKISYFIVCNIFNNEKTSFIENEKMIFLNLKDKKNIEILKNHIEKTFIIQEEKKLLCGIVKPSQIVLLISPIDKGAPKGRLILPVSQCLREILELNAFSILTTPLNLDKILQSFKPDLVICDSQCIKDVIDKFDKNQKITTFSMLFANFKGDFKELLNGAYAINNLNKNSKILISEACLHPKNDEDIARVKIPKMLENYLKFRPKIFYDNGKDFFDSKDNNFDLIIHCGGCMINEKEMINRIKLAKDSNISITNYGMTISLCNGVLERTSEIFHDLC